MRSCADLRAGRDHSRVTGPGPRQGSDRGAMLPQHDADRTGRANGRPTGMNGARAGDMADPALVAYEARLAALERRLHDMEAARPIRARRDEGWVKGVGERYALIGAWIILVAVFLVNAFIVVYFRIHSLIVTLGTGTFLQGIVLWISASETISGVSPTLIDLVIVKRIFGISLSFYYALLLCVGMWAFLEYTLPGRRLLFVGRGREVARLSGIRVDRVRALALLASSVIAAIAGVMYSGMTGSADPLSGLQLLLPAFAGAFLGATSIIPGRFNPFGSLIGVYVLTTGILGLTILGIPSFVQNLFYGGGLVVAVVLSQLVRRRQPQSFG